MEEIKESKRRISENRGDQQSMNNAIEKNKNIMEDAR